MSHQTTPTLQAILCFLSALRQTPFYSCYVVRGSFLSRQWMAGYPRHCQDLDVLNLTDYDPEQLISQVTQVVKTASQAPSQGTCSQHIQFITDGMEYREIWKDSPSPGMRFELPYTFNKSAIQTLQLDIACHDPLSNAPIEQLIDGVTVYAVPLETMAAWKLHGLFEHLNGPWQSKTLWDLYIFCRYNTLNTSRFITDTLLAFSSRLDPLTIINRLLNGDFGRSKKSRQLWRKEFPNITTAPFVELPAILEWLQAYLRPLFEAYCQEPLLTQSDVILFRVTRLRAEINKHPEAKLKLKTLSQKRKVLKHKAYNTINHLPTSRLGPAERCIQPQQYALLTHPIAHYPEHIVIVQEKLDGSCVCAYRKGDELFALGRAGDLAENSPNESRRLWAAWVADNQARLMAVLQDGEWLCGEWLAMVHGTHYALPHEPFVAFDLFTNVHHALTYQAFCERMAHGGFITPKLLHYGAPCPLDIALKKLGSGHHGSTDNPEGLIWRLERHGKIAFRAKYVRHDKIDGCYLTEVTGEPAQWNIAPKLL